ncbi:hypothetical protein [Polaromonas jejuensis]|uniref:Gfo/Idh/MocA-like oxidoreductase N-terminal domain-containing protein n=1 Tax=Polaromonas jejuensis TaxID=457502 RepID=A0ABW0QEQ3_9BURK|nr:hypothetical protein [Polaromonas jejuensis]
MTEELRIAVVGAGVIGRNIPVLVEKPVSDTVASAQQMAAAARSHTCGDSKASP